MADVDPTMKAWQDYAARSKRKAVDSNIDEPEPASESKGDMTQSAFTRGSKRPNTPEQNAQLAELLKKRAAK